MQLAKVRDMLGQRGIAAIAKERGLRRQAIYRIQDDPAGAEAALAAWEGTDTLRQVAGIGIDIEDKRRR